jgi:DNA-binding MurR/RpiR family transcriptional regulator
MTSEFADPPVGGTVDHILSILPSLIPSAQRAARICVERPGDVVEMSGNDLAEAAGTSAATVSRMSQALGFRGFQHLRLLLVRDLGAAERDDTAVAEGTEGWLRSLAERSATMLQTSLASVSAEAFERAAALIAEAPRLLVAGMGGSHPAAQAAAVAFVMNGRSCEAPADGVVQRLTASVLRPGDVCLVVSGSGANSNTLAVAAAASEAGATVIGVTSFARSPLAEVSDLVLVAGARFQSWDQGTLGSGLVQLLLLSALQMAVAERMSDAAGRARAAVQHEVVEIVADSTDVREDVDGNVRAGHADH